MLNLETWAAVAAARMVVSGDAENLITKALLVLAEQGVFAFGLFLATRPPKRLHEIRVRNDIDTAIRQLLEKANLQPDQAADLDIPAYYKALTQARAGEEQVPLHTLQRLLLTKQVMELALTYGRYHARAA